MPPLNHEYPSSHNDAEKTETIQRKEFRIGARIDTIMGAIRHDELTKLSGLKSVFHYRKPVDSPAIFYTTESVNGDYKVKAWLRNSGGLEDYCSLHTQVVKDLDVNGDVIELPASQSVERLRVSGDMFNGFLLEVKDVNTEVISQDEYLQWLEDTSETVGLITTNYYQGLPEATYPTPSTPKPLGPGGA